MPAELPHVSTSSGLPPPRGVGGYLRHTWAVVRLLWAWRREQQGLDEALREAVLQRDDRLAALGEVAATDDAPALSAFRQTLEAVVAEAAAAALRREAATRAFSTAEVDCRADLDRHDDVVEAAREVLAPLERRLRDLKSRHDTLEQAASARAGQQRSQEARQSRLREAPPEEGEAEARQRTDELKAVQARLAELAEAAERDGAGLAELVEPMTTLHAEVATATQALEAARDARRAARVATDLHLAELGAAVRAAQNHEEALGRRRQAVLMDLGRATLERPDLQLAGRAEATGALERIDRLRVARSELDRERGELDLGPMRFTLLILGACLLALVLFIASR